MSGERDDGGRACQASHLLFRFQLVGAIRIVAQEVVKSSSVTKVTKSLSIYLSSIFYGKHEITVVQGGVVRAPLR